MLFFYNYCKRDWMLNIIVTSDGPRISEIECANTRGGASTSNLIRFAKNSKKKINRTKIWRASSLSPRSADDSPIRSVAAPLRSLARDVFLWITVFFQCNIDLHFSGIERNARRIRMFTYMFSLSPWNKTILRLNSEYKTKASSLITKIHENGAKSADGLARNVCIYRVKFRSFMLFTYVLTVFKEPCG